MFKALEVEVKSKHGIHARPAASLAQLASKFESDIRISFRNREVNAKSIIGLMTLAAAQGKKLNITAIGRDSDEAVTTIKAFLEREDID